MQNSNEVFLKPAYTLDSDFVVLWFTDAERLNSPCKEYGCTEGILMRGHWMMIFDARVTNRIGQCIGPE